MALYTAFIIEPRQHLALQFVINNMVQNLDERWKILVFHGLKNEDYVQNIIVKDDIINKNKDRIKLVQMNVDNLTKMEASNMLCKESFYDHIDTEMFLMLQTDAMISSVCKNLVYNYMNYDFVGAPWQNECIGNGGLSLRRKSKMLEIIRFHPNDTELPEDVYFSSTYENEMNIKKPTYEEATHFSIEKCYNGPAFGIHGCWGILSQNTLKSINEFCIGLDELIRLNKLHDIMARS